MSTSENGSDRVIEVFISYEKEFEAKALRLFNTLFDKYELKVWIDVMEIKQGDDVFKKTTEAISKTKLMLCCINKAYPSSSKCKNDVAMAYTNDKPIMMLMVEDVPFTEFNSIAFAIGNAERFNLYDGEPASSQNPFHGEKLDKILESMENVLGRKLYNRRSKKSIRKFSNIPTTNEEAVAAIAAVKKNRRVKFPTAAISTAFHTTDNAVQITTITTEERIVDKLNIHFKAFEDHMSQLENPSITELGLRPLRSNPLFQTIQGFNRMIMIETKGKYLITSSYNQSIVVLDASGNWLERKNPNSVLKQPWGICHNSTEVFVGDNEARCIFVFDYNLKFLRQFANNVSTGLFELVYDYENKEIMIANLYDSQVLVVDEKQGRLRKKAVIPSPLYMRLAEGNLFVLSTDYIYVLEKNKFDVMNTIKLYNSDYIFGLHVDKDLNVYTTAHDVDEDGNKSRDIFLYILRGTDKYLLKKVHVPLAQVNDMIPYNGHFFFLSDTHLDIFDFDGLGLEKSKNK